eukprot:CAMPEP_0115732096 /NCGR_PEP_ID=MMETSP0272-20121206/84940_1 /TAXON_ID=71861 /ORGANISM="Scrippsiella trochoidea, Strain CCMP3099" /LENGTH=98 /DNA_ID=CAMNT_0003175985 /DNA_START=92 /DNA_END=388 /DNA_ORIENTATION=-
MQDCCYIKARRMPATHPSQPGKLLFQLLPGRDEFASFELQVLEVLVVQDIRLRRVPGWLHRRSSRSHVLISDYAIVIIDAECAQARRAHHQQMQNAAF